MALAVFLVVAIAWNLNWWSGPNRLRMDMTTGNSAFVSLEDEVGEAVVRRGGVRKPEWSRRLLMEGAFADGRALTLPVDEVYWLGHGESLSRVYAYRHKFDVQAGKPDLVRIVRSLKLQYMGAESNALSQIDAAIAGVADLGEVPVGTSWASPSVSMSLLPVRPSARQWSVLIRVEWESEPP